MSFSHFSPAVRIWHVQTWPVSTKWLHEEVQRTAATGGKVPTSWWVHYGNDQHSTAGEISVWNCRNSVLLSISIKSWLVDVEIEILCSAFIGPAVHCRSGILYGRSSLSSTASADICIANTLPMYVLSGPLGTLTLWPWQILSIVIAKLPPLVAQFVGNVFWFEISFWGQSFSKGGVVPQKWEGEGVRGDHNFGPWSNDWGGGGGG